MKLVIEPHKEPYYEWIGKYTAGYYYKEERYIIGICKRKSIIMFLKVLMTYRKNHFFHQLFFLSDIILLKELLVMALGVELQNIQEHILVVLATFLGLQNNLE